MIKKVLAMSGLMFYMSHAANGQVPPPKYESRLHHVFGSHRDVENLQQRFESLKCALVLIVAGQKLGTGFYISSDGAVATASHVLGDRTFSRNRENNKNIDVSFATPPIILVTNSKGERTEVPAGKVEFNPDAWLDDIARIETGTKTSCWLREGEDVKSSPGERLITMGFPGLSFQTLTLYTGIMSARLKTNLPTAILNTGEAVTPSIEFIRVQMPISTGLSGAPILDDENRAIGIVTNAGGWTQELDLLLRAFHGGAFQTLQPAPNPQQPPNTITFNLNFAALTAELAGLFHDYASPGYGDAVPLRYLKKPQQQNQPSASPAR
jgi:hypothetical protein